MGNKKILNNRRAIIALFIVLFTISLLIYNRVARADVAANKVAIKNIFLTGIDTGSGNFDNSDGLDYNDANSYTKDSGYVAGNDANKSNRIVRSFDSLTYHFNFELMGKNPGDDFEDRTVNVTVTLSDEEAKYVTFNKDSKPGEKKYTYSFNSIDTYGDFRKDITLYVLGGPNGTKIHPKFEIQESTNTDTNYLVSLGRINDDTTYYEYDTDKSNKYSTVSNISGFVNYMPTVVSSKTATMSIDLIADSGQSQKATYKDALGRYLTYEFGISIDGDDYKGIKGLTMPNGSNISFDIALSQDGNEKIVSLEDSWVRLYTPNNISNINPTVVSLPYADTTESMKKTLYPGTISIVKKDDNNYSVGIKDYNIAYKSATTAADNNTISKSKYYIGTYALTIFSKRTKEDGKNDITSHMTISNGKAVDTSNQNILMNTVSSSRVNQYYEIVDYSLIGEFYDEGNNKLSSGENGKGSTSKGTTLTYKTVFNYKKTLSDQGLKEVIKVDPNAFRVVPKSDTEDIKITVESPDGTKISDKDFEVKYVTGNYSNENYSVVNYDDSTIDSRLNSEDIDLIKSSCSYVKNNLGNYNSDQIMNLYGGPCIKANEGVETSFDKISKAKTSDNKEIPITKVIVQTKKGIVLPDNVKVTIEVPVRVRNVSDITQTYQATVVATSSDYDAKISYYGPRVTDDDNSITSPDNYRKTVYAGSDISSIDTDSVWGDSVKFVNFTSRQVITVTNKNSDGSIKTRYDSSNSETINYNIKTTIQDNNEVVGADDTWYINHLKIYVNIPEGLDYVPDSKLGNPEVIQNNGSVTLVYTLPYTKANHKIDDINFKATISPKITGTAIPLTVTSRVEAINVNNEVDMSYFGSLSSSFVIYVTGASDIIPNQIVGTEGSIVEKNSEFSYILKAYNNTADSINDYEILDVLPVSGNEQGSNFDGKYKVKVTLPDSLGMAKVYCSTNNKIVNNIDNKNNEFVECSANEEFISATAIKITDIPINAYSYMDDIKISIKPENNNYSNKYVNSFIGQSAGTIKTNARTSNKVTVKVISRSISGRAFMDVNEDGIENSGDTYLSDIKMSLYKLDNDNNMSFVSSTKTDKNGEYKFKDLDRGKYKIRVEEVDSDKYDLTLRYATDDTAHDSDAYKINEKTFEISAKKTPGEVEGIRFEKDIESYDDMNVGFISKKSFGFDIKKYITKIELNSATANNTYNYANQSRVSLSVKNSLKATARVYYGIKIENNSTSSGYVRLVHESIPEGLNFNINDPYNNEWIYQEGQVRSVKYENDLIKPGETRYLQIVLDMPTQAEARTFINTVTLLNIEKYEPEKLSEDTNAEPSTYNIGDAVSYAGVNWHVIKTEDINGEEIVTLLADSGEVKDKKAHTSSTTDTYKWSTSIINNYINNGFVNKNSLNLPILYDNNICDDASGLPSASFGGTLDSNGICQSNIYKTYKVRLLTENEFITLNNSGISDLSWLYGNSDFWLMNSVWVEQQHDVYGRITDITNVKNLAKFVSKANTSVQTGYDPASLNSWIHSNVEKEVRPVIKVSSRNVILE